jgi:class 3 adenylate cyclase
VVAEHRCVLRGAFAEYAGVEVDTQGDAFFVAFSTAAGAVGTGRAGSPRRWADPGADGDPQAITTAREEEARASAGLDF